MSHIAAIMPECKTHIDERCANRGSLMGVSTGFYDLDNYTSGLQKSDLILLGSRPSMGKTSFALNIASHVALREHKPVLFFSLEMGKEQLALRLLCAEAEIDAHKIKTGELGQHESPKLQKAIEKLEEAPLYIDDTHDVTDVRILFDKAYEAQLELGNPFGLIVIDYVQLIGTKKFLTHENRVQEMSLIARSLKNFARDIKTPVLALSQLSRAVENRHDKRPVLSDLRDSGSLEDDADLVMFIYRDEYYNKDSECPGTAEINIAKHRNGAIGSINLLFRNSITRFLNPAHRKIQTF